MEAAKFVHRRYDVRTVAQSSSTRPNQGNVRATVKGVLILSFLGVLLNAIVLAFLFARNSSSTRFN
jgi:hypothetical protein